MLYDQFLERATTMEMLQSYSCRVAEQEEASPSLGHLCCAEDFTLAQYVSREVVGGALTEGVLT